MITLANIPAKDLALATAEVRPFVGTADEVPTAPTALKAMAALITDWHATPLEAAELVAALFARARGTS